MISIEYLYRHPGELKDINAHICYDFPMGGFLRISNLSFSYPHYDGIRNRQIFKDLTFSVEKGEIAVFLAPPESGKSTLSRIITALVPRYTGGTIEGEISLGELNIRKEKPYNLLSSAGIVFQDPEEQILTPEVESEIGFALESSGYNHDYITRKTDEVIKKTAIRSLSGMNPAFLSGGEKRKLLLACLFASGPELWVLDETFEEIDPEGRVFLLELLKKDGKTVLILTSKMLDIYRRYCSSFFLYDGEKLLKDSPSPGEEFIDRALECGVFLDSAKLARNMKFAEKGRPDGEVFLKAEKIAFRYGNSGFSLDIDNFYLKSGEVVVLIGRNGSGKSTLARTISGLLVPESGLISLGKDGSFSNSSPDDLNRNVAYLFQNPDYQLFLPTVGEELAFGLKGRKRSGSELRKTIEETVTLFRLESPEAPPAIMSYGARKRLQAAIYYLLNKRIVIIDEADSGLSFNDYTLILKNLKNLDPPPAIMIISHDIMLSSGLADRILIMENGSLAGSGAEEKFRNLLEISTAGNK